MAATVVVFAAVLLNLLVDLDDVPILIARVPTRLVAQIHRVPDVNVHAVGETSYLAGSQFVGLFDFSRSLRVDLFEVANGSSAFYVVEYSAHQIRHFARLLSRVSGQNRNLFATCFARSRTFIGLARVRFYELVLNQKHVRNTTSRAANLFEHLSYEAMVVHPHSNVQTEHFKSVFETSVFAVIDVVHHEHRVASACSGSFDVILVQGVVDTSVVEMVAVFRRIDHPCALHGEIQRRTCLLYTSPSPRD